LRFDSKGLIKEARIVPGAAFPSWRRVKEAEDLLIGQKPSKDTFQKAGKIVSDVMITLSGRRWSTEYKEPVIAVLVRRALEACVSGEVTA
jgi:CO/xanthine dehydrogenase FAD-binding subunit